MWWFGSRRTGRGNGTGAFETQVVCHSLCPWPMIKLHAAQDLANVFLRRVTPFPVVLRLLVAQIFGKEESPNSTLFRIPVSGGTLEKVESCRR